MIRKWFWLVPLLCLFLPATAPRAETVHLTTGEAVEGRIVAVDENTVTIESERGFGRLQIDRKDIALIEFDSEARDLSHRIGIGYYKRSTPQSVGSQAAEYGTDAVSIKLWLDRDDSVDLLLGFYSASEGSQTLLEVFTLDLRYANVFTRRASLDLYWGASAGYIRVTDRTAGRDFSDNGTSLRAFLGTEIFFTGLPNLGISAEIGAGVQTVGDREVTSLSATTFPTFALRYYY